MVSAAKLAYRPIGLVAEHRGRHHRQCVVQADLDAGSPTRTMHRTRWSRSTASARCCWPPPCRARSSPPSRPWSTAAAPMDSSGSPASGRATSRSLPAPRHLATGKSPSVELSRRCERRLRRESRHWSTLQVPGRRGWRASMFAERTQSTGAGLRSKGTDPDGRRGGGELAEDLMQGDLQLGRRWCRAAGSSCRRAAGRWSRSPRPSAAAARRARRVRVRSAGPRAGRSSVRPVPRAGRSRRAAKIVSIWPAVNVGRCSAPRVTTSSCAPRKARCPSTRLTPRATSTIAVARAERAHHGLVRYARDQQHRPAGRSPRPRRPGRSAPAARPPRSGSRRR